MLIRSQESDITTVTTDTFELTETIRFLADAVINGSEARNSHYMARKALACAESATWRIREQSNRIALLEKAAVTDQLTGVLNRRGFEEELHRSLANAHRYKECGAVVYIDLDGFKNVNDVHGHAVGDILLKKAATVLTENTRDTDHVARIGGDEFIVLMSRTTLKNATHRAEALDWELNHTAIEWQNQIIQLNASLGTEPFGPEDDGNSIVIRADQAMYRQKKAKTVTLRRVK